MYKVDELYFKIVIYPLSHFGDIDNGDDIDIVEFVHTSLKSCTSCTSVLGVFLQKYIPPLNHVTCVNLYFKIIQIYPLHSVITREDVGIATSVHTSLTSCTSALELQTKI